MSNNQEKKLYLVKGKNNLYHPKLLTNSETKTIKNIFILNDNKPFELKKIVDKANEIFKKLQFKIKYENPENNEWQNINMSNSSNLKELAKLIIKVNGKNIYLKDIFPNPQNMNYNKILKNPNSKILKNHNNVIFFEDIYPNPQNMNYYKILKNPNKVIFFKDIYPNRNSKILKEPNSNSNNNNNHYNHTIYESYQNRRMVNAYELP
jgi:hypothetical protein